METLTKGLARVGAVKLPFWIHMIPPGDGCRQWVIWFAAAFSGILLSKLASDLSSFIVDFCLS